MENAETVENLIACISNQNAALLKKIEQQFEETVKERDKRLEEAAASEAALRRQVEQRDSMIKQLEKTVAEREHRLYQVTTQLEEMKRVQEMIAKLVSKSASS